jgi:hypothetical protein
MRTREKSMRSIIALSVLFSPLAFAQLEILPADATSSPQATAAVAAASRAGDEKLSCKQLQNELTQIATSPAMQNFFLQQAAALSSQLPGAAATAGTALASAQSPELAAATAAATEDVPAEAAKKKGGFMKKLGLAGQAASVAGGLGGLGGRGAGAIAAAQGAAQVAGAAGAEGAAEAAGAIGAASAIGGLSGGDASDIAARAATDAAVNAATTAATNAAVNTVANHAVSAFVGSGALNPALIQVASMSAQQLAGSPPELVRANRVMQLGATKKCDWAAGVPAL